MCNQSHLELISRYANLNLAYDSLIEHRKHLDADILRLESKVRSLEADNRFLLGKLGDIWGWAFGE